MPVIRSTGRGEVVPNLRDHLSGLLVRELMGQRSRNSPVIYEMPTGAADEVDVIVIWEAWKGLTPADRTSIIRRAYEQFSRELTDAIHYIDPAKAPVTPLIPRLSKVAIGATWEEASEQGLLPYSVQPMVRAGEVDLPVLHHVMIEAGAIETPTGVQLRFPDARLASDVHTRLVEEMPEAHWSIVEDVGSIDDWRGR